MAFLATFTLPLCLACYPCAMAETETEREQRINAAAQEIKAVVERLPDKEEQRAAEVKALVKGVAEEADDPQQHRYRQELSAFTGITHELRTQMGAQLEPKFREYLRDRSPRENPKLSGKEQQNELAADKAALAEKASDGLSRLGLAFLWEKDSEFKGPCYLGADSSNPRGRYLIHKCGSSGYVDQITDWHQGRGLEAADIEARLKRLTLVDAAAPGEQNCLQPRRNR